jgi:hypothetical protein
MAKTLLSHKSHIEHSKSDNWIIWYRNDGGRARHVFTRQERPRPEESANQIRYGLYNALNKNLVFVAYSELEIEAGEREPSRGALGICAAPLMEQVLHFWTAAAGFWLRRVSLVMSAANSGPNSYNS